MCQTSTNSKIRLSSTVDLKVEANEHANELVNMTLITISGYCDQNGGKIRETQISVMNNLFFLQVLSRRRLHMHLVNNRRRYLNLFCPLLLLIYSPKNHISL